MNKRKGFFVITGILIVLLIPLTYILWQYANEALDVFVWHKQDYLITQEPLTYNSCKKYGNRANFNISFKGQVFEGQDGCLFAADSGDVVKVYFNKNDLSKNGIVWVLWRNLILQLLAFLGVVGYIIRKVYTYK